MNINYIDSLLEGLVRVDVAVIERHILPWLHAVMVNQGYRKSVYHLRDRREHKEKDRRNPRYAVTAEEIERTFNRESRTYRENIPLEKWFVFRPGRVQGNYPAPVHPDKQVPFLVRCAPSEYGVAASGQYTPLALSKVNGPEIVINVNSPYVCPIHGRRREWYHERLVKMYHTVRDALYHEFTHMVDDWFNLEGSMLRHPDELDPANLDNAYFKRGVEQAALLRVGVEALSRLSAEDIRKVLSGQMDDPLGMTSTQLGINPTVTEYFRWLREKQPGMFRRVVGQVYSELRRRGVRV